MDGRKLLQNRCTSFGQDDVHLSPVSRIRLTLN
jgi:hypothetical protein